MPSMEEKVVAGFGYGGGGVLIFREAMTRDSCVVAVVFVVV